MTIIILVGGLIVLILGGELLVRGAVSIATRLGVSTLMIGLTLVGFGTSTPELVTSLQAAIAGSPGIAVGNVVGSNTANILLILGLAALLRPVTATPAAFRRDGTVLVLSALACLGVTLSGAIGRGAGAMFVVMLVGYVVVTYVLERTDGDASADMHAAEAGAARPTPGGPLLAAASLIAGLVLTIIGARLLVTASVDLATSLGVPETIVGLTIVAVGTSLPELVTSVVAAVRGQSDVAFGNIVGSNIYNVLGILGVTALVHPLEIPREIMAVDIWVMLGATGILLAATLSGWRVTRLEGALMVVLYTIYVAYLVAVAGGF